MDRGYGCEDAAASEGHYGGGVEAAFVGAVRETAYHYEGDAGGDKR